MIPIVTIDGVVVSDWSSLHITGVLNSIAIMTIIFDDSNGVASLHYPEDDTILREIEVTDANSKYPFRGMILNLQPEADKKSRLTFLCVGHMYQFGPEGMEHIDFNCVQEAHVYTASEGEEETVGERDEFFTGMCNKVGTADGLAAETMFEDTNKDWTGLDWTAPAGKYGIIFLKNPARPAEAEAHDGTPLGSRTDCYTNDDAYFGCTKTGGSSTQTYIELTFNTTIPRADISEIKVKTTFDNIYYDSVAGGTSGKIEIYDYDGSAYVLLETISSQRQYTRIYQTDSTETVLDPLKMISATGEMKIKITGGRRQVYSGIYSSEVHCYFIRCALTYDDEPSLQFAISAHTSDGAPETITCAANIHETVDELDYYIIALRTDYVIASVLTDTALYPGNEVWKTITANSLTAGTKYLGRKWEETPATNIVKYAAEFENYDYILQADLDFLTQDSSSAVSSGLKFDATAVNMQINAVRGAAEGAQMYNRVKVRWKNGVEIVTDNTSYTTYNSKWKTYYHVDRAIEGSEEAASIAAKILAFLKDAKKDLLIPSSSYVYVTLGTSFVVNLPSLGISAVTHVLKKIQWDFRADGSMDVAYTLSVPGSGTKRVKSQKELDYELKDQVRELRQQIVPGDAPLSSSTTSAQAHAPNHFSGGSDELLLDEDNMATDSATKGSSQQALKAYADTKSTTLDSAFDLGKEIDGATTYANRLQFGGGKKFHWHLIGTPNIQSYNMISSNAVFFMNNLYYDAAYTRDFGTNMGLMLQLFTDVNDASHFQFIGFTTGNAFTKHLKIFPKIASIDFDADGPIHFINANVRIGGASDHLLAESNGDTYWVGGGGLPFAGISAKDNAVETAIAVAGTKVQVTIFDTDDAGNNATPDHTNDHITITKAGMYFAMVSCTIKSVAGGAIVVLVDLYKNNGAAAFNNVHAHRALAGGGGDIGSISLSGNIDLAANDTIELWVTNATNTSNLIVEDITLSVVQIGGT